MKNPHFSLFRDEAMYEQSVWSKIKGSGSQKAIAVKNLSPKEKAEIVRDGIPGALLTGANYGLTIASYAGASATALLTVGGLAMGPIAPAVLAGLGILKMVSDKSSNVEKRHKILLPYVWTVLDNNPPMKPLDDIAGKAAMYLITKGKTQQSLGLKDFKTKSAEFDKWVGKYESLSVLHNYEDTSKIPKDVFDEWEGYRAEHITTGFAKSPERKGGAGGAVWEFMRRALHWGNYAQSYKICGELMQKNKRLPDFVSTNPELANIRQAIIKLQLTINKDTGAYKKYKMRNP